MQPGEYIVIRSSSDSINMEYFVTLQEAREYVEQLEGYYPKIRIVQVVEIL